MLEQSAPLGTNPRIDCLTCQQGPRLCLCSTRFAVQANAKARWSSRQVRSFRTQSFVVWRTSRIDCPKQRGFCVGQSLSVLQVPGSVRGEHVSRHIQGASIRSPSHRPCWSRLFAIGASVPPAPAPAAC